jgi:hypothetical protein
MQIEQVGLDTEMEKVANAFGVVGQCIVECIGMVALLNMKWRNKQHKWRLGRKKLQL